MKIDPVKRARRARAVAKREAANAEALKELKRRGGGEPLDMVARKALAERRMAGHDARLERRLRKRGELT